MGSLLLGDLNDYIQPSVACIKPEPVPPKDATEKKPIKINLNDCLACSGCITSAETILVTEQTHHQLYSVLETRNEPSGKQHVVVSIAPSVRVALAIKYKLSEGQVFTRLHHFFTKVLGVDVVLDLAFASNISLRAAATEFVKDFKARTATTKSSPLYSSECPGWICFAEKKHGNLLNRISTVRSPQQIMGAIVKSPYYANSVVKNASLKRDDIYHVAIMPCYDKKLEASRKEFTDEGGNRHVDCVITTGELISMIEEKTTGNLTELPETPLERLESCPFRTWICHPSTGSVSLLGFPGSSAGGYLSFVMKHAAKELFGIDLEGELNAMELLEVKPHRNQDYTEYFLYDQPRSNSDRRILLKFAAIYGFKNIQTFIQKSKTGRIDYDYVEIMACPGACLFGGGQPKLEDSTKTALDAHRSQIEQLYSSKPSWSLQTLQDEITKVNQWIEANPGDRRSILYTSYHAVDDSSIKNPLAAVQWIPGHPKWRVSQDRGSE